jgi:hypothetical protein
MARFFVTIEEVVCPRYVTIEVEAPTQEEADEAAMAFAEDDLHEIPWADDDDAPYNTTMRLANSIEITPAGHTLPLPRFL